MKTLVVLVALCTGVAVSLPSTCLAVTCSKSGHICTPTQICANAYCNITSVSVDTFTGKCLKYQSEGHVCWGDGMCSGDQHFCDSYGVCRQKRDVGQRCTRSALCKQTPPHIGKGVTGLQCDPVLEKCVSPYTQTPGSPCGANIINGLSKECQTGSYCSDGSCALQKKAGDTCKSDVECWGDCVDGKCVGYFTIESGRPCNGNSLLCLSGVCGRNSKLCVPVTTPSTGSGFCTTSDSCADDAYCVCDYKIGSKSCVGTSPKVISGQKSLYNCLAKHKDPWNCKGLMDHLNHVMSNTDSNPCSAASTLAISLLAALLSVIVFLF
jgi:hypothetical protein